MSPDRSTPDQVYPYGCNNLGSRPISVNAILWRQQKTHEWLGERAILAGKDKDVEERNNIIQSVTGKGHSNAWPGTASILLIKRMSLCFALARENIYKIINTITCCSLFI
jgi:hypothetical protein